MLRHSTGPQGSICYWSHSEKLMITLEQNTSEHIWFHLVNVFVMLFVHDIDLLLIKSLLMLKHKQCQLLATCWSSWHGTDISRWLAHGILAILQTQCWLNGMKHMDRVMMYNKQLVEIHWSCTGFGQHSLGSEVVGTVETCMVDTLGVKVTGFGINFYVCWVRWMIMYQARLVRPKANRKKHLYMPVYRNQ